MIRRMREFYFRITKEVEYFTLGKREQKIIASGLKRNMCLAQAFLAKKPYNDSQECHTYDLRYDLKCSLASFSALKRPSPMFLQKCDSKVV